MPPSSNMADVRALLRQQRAARRIEHPHASYSDSGKLSCAICLEPIKAESLWEGHLRSAGHRQRVQVLSNTTRNSNGPSLAGFVDQTSAATTPSTNKRKHSDSDDEMGDTFDEDAARRKKSRPDLVTTSDENQRAAAERSKPLTPPLTRRTSGTPTFGIEMQMPSRPATPVAIREERERNGSGSAGTPMSITPKPASQNRSPLIPEEPQQKQPPNTSAPAPVTDDLWAEFEADLLQEKKKPAAVAALEDSDAVISAPVMTNEEIAAKSEEDERQKRRALADIELEDEKEEATRALETEFEVMEELEARARKLRERREALRVQGGGGSAAIPAVKGSALGKENAAVPEDEDDEDDDEEEDDWDGFRFRA
ncbi:hypothetical protein QBC41DRAFT_312149 [Cercophora samala]|uniref:Coiled-coil domain-containing protein 16 n=1 Tax=Cercophora samala TaxID=330535 RepID=A0AA39ZL60_9PEZI|nr:hypothetical protein QBC41DRAFT_312149 [Cercophora samala]